MVCDTGTLMCVCVHKYTCEHMQLCKYVQAQRFISDVFLYCSLPYILRPGLLLNPAFVDSATPGWLASSPSCLWLSSTGIIDVCQYTQIFIHAGAGELIQVLLLIINWASLLALLWLFWLRILHKWIISIPEDIGFVWMFNYL